MFFLLLLEIDESLFHWINGVMTCKPLDWIMPVLRNKYFWFPLYAYILAFVFFNFKFRAASIFVIYLLLSVVISDMTSSKGIKEFVKRERPCNHPILQSEVRLLVECGSGYSFTSSHASNHFSMAVFLFLTMGRIFKKIRWPLILWAASICYAQVYVGVHYPLDVLFGAIWGFLIGSFLAVFYNGWVSHSIYPQP